MAQVPIFLGKKSGKLVSTDLLRKVSSQQTIGKAKEFHPLEGKDLQKLVDFPSLCRLGTLKFAVLGVGDTTCTKGGVLQICWPDLKPTTKPRCLPYSQDLQICFACQTQQAVISNPKNSWATYSHLLKSYAVPGSEAPARPHLGAPDQLFRHTREVWRRKHFNCLMATSLQCIGIGKVW